MRLEGLRIFAQHVDRSLAGNSVAAEIYYKFQEKWHGLVTERPCEGTDVSMLEHAMREPVSHHSAKSLDAWFYFKDVDAAVRLTFTHSPKADKRSRFRETICEALESASNAYRVAYTPLTQLLARDPFRQRVADAIAEARANSRANETPQETEIPRLLAVMALDIDHFKQVNDSWGHLYGDMVLRAFARRLEKRGNEVRRSDVGNPMVFLGHPSGEEFLILVHASVGRDQMLEWANSFRECIAEHLMPTDDELKILIAETGVTVTPPALHERATFASVGLAVYNASWSSESNMDPVSDLLKRADVALYRAKSGGRNQVVSYDDILSNCGRVIEFDGSTMVAALDIGMNVGVAVGQEFRVFPAVYSGKTRFYVSDGRTRRALGTYPRVEIARIVVFDVQSEMSFAYLEGESRISIEAGSHLEAIPAGSIRHLLPSASKYISRLHSSSIEDGIESMRSFVKAESQSASPFAVVIRFSKDAEYLRQFGSVALNSALAKLYSKAKSVFQAAKCVELIDRSSICIVGSRGVYKESLLRALVEQLAAELPDLGVVAGVFCETDVVASRQPGLEPLRSEHAMEFARLAATDAGRSADARIRHFGYSTAAEILHAQRRTGASQVAYADFQSFRHMGMNSAALVNIGGLAASASGRPQEAFELFAAAMAMDGKNIIYKSNLGSVAIKVGQIEPALQALNELPDTDLDRLRIVHKHGYSCYAHLLAIAAINGSGMFDYRKFKLVAESALADAESQSSRAAVMIKEALVLVSKDPLFTVAGMPNQTPTVAK